VLGVETKSRARLGYQAATMRKDTSRRACSEQACDEFLIYCGPRAGYVSRFAKLRIEIAPEGRRRVSALDDNKMIVLALEARR